MTDSGAGWQLSVDQRLQQRSHGHVRVGAGCDCERKTMCVVDSTRLLERLEPRELEVNQSTLSEEQT